MYVHTFRVCTHISCVYTHFVCVHTFRVYKYFGGMCAHARTILHIDGHLMYRQGETIPELLICRQDLHALAALCQTAHTLPLQPHHYLHTKSHAQ